MALGEDALSDGCTAWLDGNWRLCCEIHDQAYADQLPKLLSDLDLASCVSAYGHPLIALGMLLAVTLFGWLFYPSAKAKADARKTPPE